MTVFNRERHSSGSGVAAAYTIENSCRFNDDDSPATAHTYNAVGSSDKIATLSWWMKLGNLGITRKIFDFDSGQEQIDLHTNDKMRITYASVEALITTQVFRDCGAWYHCVWRIDTTDAAGGDRLRLYVNGSEVTAFDTDSNPTVNTIMGGIGINTNVATVGATQGVANEFDGYLAEVAMCDGQSLGPGSFGETDDNGQWVPKDLSGLTFGNNGFWLDFAVAPGTGNGAGTDVSGNANHFTDTGLAAADQVNDSPSDSSADDIGNYCVLNPVANTNGSDTFADGNLKITGHNSDNFVLGTVRPEGKVYMEWDITTMSASGASTRQDIGIIRTDQGGWSGTYPSLEANGDFTGTRVPANLTYSDGTSGTDYTNAADGDLIAIALDTDAGKMWIRIDDGTWFGGGDPAAGTTPTVTFTVGGEWCWVAACYGTSDVSTANFGQLAYQYTAPSGFGFTHTARLPAPAIKDPSKYFQIDLFTGTGGELVRTLTDGGGGAVAPDMVWIKDRDTSVEHVLTDSARGATKELNPDSTNAETTVAEGVKSFNSSGYTLGTDGNYNTSSSLNVAWCWVEGTTPDFDIVLYTGSGSAKTVSHSLGVKPEFMMVKHRDSSTGWSWTVWHKDFGAPTTTVLELDNDGAANASAGNRWNDTEPTSSVFSVDDNGTTNENTTLYVNYLFAGIEGFSKFGSYEGNGAADGTFIWLGFRPGLIISKSIDSTSRWDMQDGKRTINGTTASIEAAGPAGEVSNAGQIDILSNGFKHRTNIDNNIAETYVYAAWAEFPFGGDGVSQARAR